MYIYIYTHTHTHIYIYIYDSSPLSSSQDCAVKRLKYQHLNEDLMSKFIQDLDRWIEIYELLPPPPSTSPRLSSSQGC